MEPLARSPSPARRWPVWGCLRAVAWLVNHALGRVGAGRSPPFCLPSPTPHTLCPAPLAADRPTHPLPSRLREALPPGVPGAHPFPSPPRLCGLAPLFFLSGSFLSSVVASAPRRCPQAICFLTSRPPSQPWGLFLRPPVLALGKMATSGVIFVISISLQVSFGKLCSEKLSELLVRGCVWTVSLQFLPHLQMQLWVPHMPAFLPSSDRSCWKAVSFLQVLTYLF